MAKKTLDKDTAFVVGEDKILNYILAFLFFAIFMYGFIDAVRRRFINIDYQSYFLTLALLPAYLFFKKGSSRKAHIRVNKTGLYHHEQLITNWPHFINAYITQKEKKGFFELQDHFLLVVEYKKEEDKKGFRKNIPLTNTQNKSEEQVLEAVLFFWKEYRNDAGR
jgi:hypothetical protein